MFFLLFLSWFLCKLSKKKGCYSYMESTCVCLFKIDFEKESVEGMSRLCLPPYGKSCRHEDKKKSVQLGLFGYYKSLYEHSVVIKMRVP